MSSAVEIAGSHEFSSPGVGLYGEPKSGFPRHRSDGTDWGSMGAERRQPILCSRVSALIEPVFKLESRQDEDSESIA